MGGKETETLSGSGITPLASRAQACLLPAYSSLLLPHLPRLLCLQLLYQRLPLHSMVVPQKTIHGTPTWSGSSSFVYVPKALKAGSQGDICAPMPVAALFIVAHRSSLCLLIGEWTKQNVRRMEYYSALKKKECLTHVTTGREPEDIILSN